MVKKLLIIIILVILIPGLYFFSGFYNVAATGDSPVMDKMLHIISERSIKRNAGNIKNPYDLNDRDLYSKGFQEYDEMCVQCHGWSGVEPSATGKGLNPKPPGFPDEELYEFTLEDIFWVTKNGVKMTGMPAYGPTHDDETIWSIAIFLERSRNLTEEEYKNLRNRLSASGHEHHHGD